MAKRRGKSGNSNRSYFLGLQNYYRLDEAQAGIKVARRSINNLIYVDDTIFMAENQEELKNLLLKVKEESEKVGFKTQQRMNIMASSPITSWQLDGEQWKQ